MSYTSSKQEPLKEKFPLISKFIQYVSLESETIKRYEFTHNALTAKLIKQEQYELCK